MSLFLSLIYLLFVAITGYVVLSAILPAGRRHWAEIAGMSFAAGAGAWAVLMFIASVAGFSPTGPVLSLIVIITMIGGLILYSRQQLWAPTRPASFQKPIDFTAILGALAAVIILITIANVAAEALTPGLSDIDSFAIWMFKAKIAFLQPLRPIPAALLDPSLSFSHQDYPLGFPMLVSSMYAAARKLDVQLGKLVLLPIYLSLIGVLYAALRQRLRRSDALVITAIFAAAPILRDNAGLAVAEVFLVLMHACCLVLFLEWMETDNRRSLIAAGVFAAFAAFTKNEGLALLPILWLAALVFSAFRRNRGRFVDLSVSTIVTLLILMPWLCYRHFLPFTHENYGEKLTSLSTLAQDMARLGKVLPAYLDRLVDFKSAGGLWVILVISAMVGWRGFRRLPVLVLWFLLIAHLALYAVTLMVTPWSLDVLIPMVASKLLMHITPAAALLIGLHISEFRATTAIAQPLVESAG